DMIRGINDIERLVSRCAAGLASARDLVGLKESLNRLPRLCDLLTDCRIDSLRGICARLGSSDHRPPTTDISLLAEQRQAYATSVSEIAALIARAITDDPPAGVREG